MRCPLIALAILALGAGDGSGQAAEPASGLPAMPVFAMGQPPQWKPFATALGQMRQGVAGAAASLGLERPMLNPVTGLLAMSGEALGEWRSGATAAGARLIARSPGLGFGFGADWTSATHHIAPLLSFQQPLRRGGIIGGGSTVRLDWILGGNEALNLGVQLPLGQPFAGRTRPRRITAVVPRTTTSTYSPADAMPVVETTARIVSAYVNPYKTADESTLVAGSHTYGSFEAASRAYIDALATAFSTAVGDSTRGRTIAERARATVLDDAILPYDALLGQVKESGDFDVMLATAHDAFARWVRDSSGVPLGTQPRVAGTFDRWLETLRGLHRHLADEWKDSRLIWLAPQLALAPEQYDEQAEVDTLIGRAVGHPFTDHNEVGYLRTADLTLEIARSILAARQYHVLWVHDFTGRRMSGALDEVSYTMVADAYLPALTSAVQRYDSAGAFPQYFILLDQYYYGMRDGRLWMSILENPLHTAVRLGRGGGRMAAHLRERLDSLRAAVGRSKRLQREAAAGGGDRWLAQVVRVHVNITQPSDFSFRSTRLVPGVPLAPDNLARDHRKLAFYDLTETDPYTGELLVTGIGIGEHYASATWEDRGFRVRGPATLEVRAAARRLLKENGFGDDQIPLPLRATTGAARPLALADARRAVARALNMHNEPGFGAKRATVARAMLYSLTPSGSVIVVTDPLWLSETWAGLLAGAAARGSSVAIIAPAKENAPSPEPPVLALERDAMHRLLTLRDHLGLHAVNAAASDYSVTTGPDCCRGDLHVGLYASHTPITDVRGRLREMREGLTRAPWIRELIPFDGSALAALDSAVLQAGHADAIATSIARDEVPREPQLHQKTQLIARPGAIATLLRQPGWDKVLAQTIREQARATTRLADAIGAPLAPEDTAAARAADDRMQGYERSLSPTDRKRLSFYFFLGSLNHDDRGLLLDGESGLIVSGFEGSAGLVDLFYLMTRTTWIDHGAEIDRLVPAPRWWMARFARLVRPAL